ARDGRAGRRGDRTGTRPRARRRRPARVMARQDSYGIVVDTPTELWLDDGVNRNSNRQSLLTLKDGSQRAIKFRNSFGGWLNAVKRAGIDPSDIVSEEEWG